ncbi:MAG: response regulator [Pseudomonadales bacterium]|nr:response regulator [Pseudomonadales bacterium]
MANTSLFIPSRLQSSLKSVLILITIIFCSTNIASGISDLSPPLDLPSITIDDDFRSTSLGEKVLILEDPSNELAIQDLLEGSQEHRFKESTSKVINYGYTSNTYWLKTKLHFKTQHKDDWYLRLTDPLIDTADLFIVDDSGNFIIKRSGEDTPHKYREISARNPIFLIEGFPNEELTLFLKLRSQDPIQVSLSLYSESAFSEETFGEVLALGAYYGVIVVMLFYNFFIYITTKDRSYLTYCLYLAVLVPAQLGFDGLSYQFLWPDSPWWANRSVVFFSGAVALAGTAFARIFLNTRHNLPLWDKLMLLHIALASLVLPIALCAPYSLAATCGVSIAVSFASLMLSTALIGYFQNAPNARFFLFAWLTLTLGLLVRALVATGQIEATLITLYSAQFGTALETVLLSFALADRIKHIEKEKHEAQEQAAAALERSNIELQRTNEIKDEFLATISHELRTPMNGIQGMLDLLNTTHVDNKQQEYLSYAQLSTREMLKHIESILCFSEAQSRRIKIKNAPFQLNQLIYDLTTEYEERCKQKYIEFRLHKANNLPNALEGDFHQLKLVLTNLLDNAVKFTDAGFVELGISCDANDDGDQLTLNFVITDSGCGVPKRIQDSLFKPFMQADSSFSRRHGGLGIGLALSRALAEVLGGDIKFQVNAPKGSIFSFRAPLRQGDERDMPAFFSSKHCKESDTESTTKTPSILIVEDNPVNQKVLTAILRKKDYVIVTANNGEEALKCLDKTNVDLILMDCQMPIMDGFEASRKIRDRKSKYGYPPIIAVTANAMSEDRDKCIEAGMNDYLAKPVDRYKLYSTIEEWLNYEPLSPQKSA